MIKIRESSRDIAFGIEADIHFEKSLWVLAEFKRQIKSTPTFGV